MRFLREASQRALKKLEVEGVFISPEHALILRDIALKATNLTPEQEQIREKLIKRCHELERAGGS